MNILICNERFLFRFGVDRVLIILATGLKRIGHSIAFMANRFDSDIIKNITDDVIAVPGADPYIDSNEFTEQWLKTNWDRLFVSNKPDVVIVGGWPFYSSIPVFKSKCCSVLVSDHGAVPIESFTGHAFSIQEKLRLFRRRFIPEASVTVGVSDFIVNSQSIPDSDNLVPVRTVLNGADHMEFNIWQDRYLAKNSSDNLTHIKKIQKNGKKILLNLGRWEPDNYKNSGAIYTIAERLINMGHNFAIFVLCRPEDIQIPPHLHDIIFPLGFPDDGELQEIMKRADLGLSVSLWEGFNLPIAEMQWLSRPVLAFDIGAHKEVMLHPWFICSKLDEMVKKSDAVLNGKYGLSEQEYERALNKFKDFFTWDRAVSEYNDILFETNKLHDKKKEGINIIIDVTNSTKDPANTGVIRVTRRISRELQKYCEPIFVRWDDDLNEYVFPVEVEYNQLSQFNGPVIKRNFPISPDFNNRYRLSDYKLFQQDIPSWLILSETTMEQRGKHIRGFARSEGMQIATIFYDAIPVIRPELCQDSIIRENHSKYMKGLSNCDLIIPISEFSAQCLLDFWRDCGLEGCEVKANLLPGEFSGSARAIFSKSPTRSQINMLCVSTLEPRKNHRRLIEACELFEKTYPEIDWNLILIGNKYAGAFDIADFIENTCRKNPRIKWLGIVDDNRLHRAYTDATFTIYTSEIEGFGMPVMESLWHGKPCICHNDGVMAELANEGGCVTVDVTNSQAVADKIAELILNSELYTKLTEEAMSRPIKTWREYAADFWDNIYNRTKFTNQHNENKCQINTNSPTTTSHETAWDEIIYKGCITDQWQMSDSERLAIMAFLHRIQPDCAIEIGTYRGGSLSLISQYSKTVFSIDIDDEIPKKFGYLKNVSFLTGPSKIILPALLAELDQHQMYPDFVLIDGDHSAEGIKQDIEIILSYKPKKPLFMVMHDSFNPECRRGMEASNWNNSSYVKWVDIDFIPGRLVEHGGGFDGELWGGIGLAFLTPEIRTGDIVLLRSAKRMFEIISQDRIC